jgi:Terminase RNaseH-like domain
LPRDVTWYCDPSGATERNEFRLAGFTVHPGKNALRAGIGAANARIESGRLFVLEKACPNLIAEAGLYHYSDAPAERDAEVPVDEHNHALSALRYMISCLDDRHLAGRPAKPVAMVDEAARRARQAKAQRDYLWNNPKCWE